MFNNSLYLKLIKQEVIKQYSSDIIVNKVMTLCQENIKDISNIFQKEIDSSYNYNITMADLEDIAYDISEEYIKKAYSINKDFILTAYITIQDYGNITYFVETKSHEIFKDTIYSFTDDLILNSSSAQALKHTLNLALNFNMQIDNDFIEYIINNIPEITELYIDSSEEDIIQFIDKFNQ